ncbi:MAG: hypothetical protein IJL94_04050, partial [Erysipelotrichaceae bacterium]|nr:hypothetical protein [Erysipelotrichaceae bacterium]
MKKLLSVIIAICCIVSSFCFVVRDRVVFADDEEDYSYCFNGSNLTEEQKNACRLYKQQIEEERQANEAYLAQLNAEMAELKANIAEQ